MGTFAADCQSQVEDAGQAVMVRDPEAGYSLSVQMALHSVLAGSGPLERQHDELTEDGGKSMRILNRVIVAAALVVPMGLGVSGIAGADVPAGSSVLPAQIAASENDDLEHCDEDDGFLGFLSGLSGKGSSNGSGCGEDGEDANGPLG